ncbi:MAG: hypothetical protein MK207_10975 [Saprospiraceae bacterium]|nr:hypothetical protein [Saprospiraceae bacterium]
MNPISKIFHSLDDNLPKFNSLDEGIDFLMKYLYRFSEDLSEDRFYINKRWLEVRDDINFQESLLHVFEEDGKYLRILEGDISTGRWEYSHGGLILEFNGYQELYENTFLNEKFFILQKHGDHSSKGDRSKYLFIADEQLAKKLNWPELLLTMYDIYKSNTQYLFIVLIFITIISIILILSIM